MKLPQGFTDLATAHGSPTGTFVNIVGVVTDIQPAKQTARMEYMMTIAMIDESFRNSYPELKGFTARFFYKELEQMPDIESCGDVVLLRAVKMFMFSGRMIALSNQQTAHLVFPNAAIPKPGFQIAFNDKKRIDCRGVPEVVEKLSLTEQAYVIDIKEAMDVAVAPPIVAARDDNKRPMGAMSLPTRPPSPKKFKTAMSNYGPKFRLIEEIHDKLFATLVGEVVKCFKLPNGDCDLYITDYTENRQVFHYPDPEAENEEVREGDTFGYNGAYKKGWPGPWGFLVLKLNVKQPHASFANSQVQQGDLVMVRNVKCKIQAVGLRLEGDMWIDERHPHEINIRKVKVKTIKEVEALLERKEQYWSGRKQSKPELPQARQEISFTAGEKQTKHKQSKRKKKQQAEVRLEYAAGQISDGETLSNPDRGHRSDTNRYIRCSHDNVRILSLKDILDPDNVRHTGTLANGQSFVVPFINARYRAKVRVVDFAPKALEDFSAPSTSSDDDASDSMAWMREDSQRYEWAFRLLLEDARGSHLRTQRVHRLWVDVGHEQAQFLFGNGMSDPKDLKHDSQQLSMLREKLFVLWGNLEEAGGHELSNLFFECCIMEYGMRLDGEDANDQHHPQGWKRMYSMFGTTIL